MKYTPRRPRDDVNVSRTHPLAEAAMLLTGLGLIFVFVVVALMFLVEIVLWFVPEERELRLFGAWQPEDLVTVSADDPRRDDLQALFERLARHWPETGYRFRIEIADSPAVNAVAMPGGLVVVTAGLLDEVRSENELAFVLGHELGHFRNRDHIRGLGRGVALAMLFAAIGAGNGDATLGASIADLALRGFSRSQEERADAFGLEIVHAEYGHVAEAWRFFERIDDGDGTLADLASYVSTHPAPHNRVEKLLRQAAANGWSVTGPISALGWSDAAATAP